MLGLDYLAGAKYRDVILREHPAGWAAGFFANVDGFGPCWGTAEALLATGRCPRIRIQAVWDDSHTYRPAQHDRAIMRAINRANALKRKFPGVEVQLSVFCEHKIRGAQLRSLLERASAAAQGVAIVNNPSPDGDFVDGYINEVHGLMKAPRGRYNFSFDGTSSVDGDCQMLKERHLRADTFFFWVPQFNLLKNDVDKTPRASRRAVPTGQLIDSVIALKQDKGLVSLPDRWLWKSHADQHKVPVPAARELKPVALIPPKVARLELVADNGQVIAVSGGPEPYKDGRWRYYFNAFGYELAAKAIRIQGHPVVSLRAGGQVRGRINPAFRENEYRH